MLLNEMLHQLGEGGIHSTAELARGLGVSRTLVAAMTDDLVRRGYLMPIGHTCSTACGECSLARACNTLDGPETTARTFVLTEKGRRSTGASS